MSQDIQLIIGLGNPGPEYHSTRHNVGQWLIEKIAEVYHTSFKLEKKLNGRLSEIRLDGQKIRLFLPDTYMNESGRAIIKCCQYFDTSPQKVLIAHDELDLDPGTIKIKTGGGHGGHNGLRDTFQKCASRDFHRIRVGIGHPGDRNLVTNYVLSKPSKSDQLKIHTAIDEVVSTLPQLLGHHWQNAITHINSFKG